MVGASLDLQDGPEVHLSPRLKNVGQVRRRFYMESEELVQLMNQVDEKGIDWSKVEAKIKVQRQILNLYSVSGPVPVAIIKNLKKVVEEGV
jgi:hypothetical protein